MPLIEVTTAWVVLWTLGTAGAQTPSAHRFIQVADGVYAAVGNGTIETRATAGVIITATDVVIFALAVLGLNILVGWTGLTSFGHGAWFGIGAYAVAILQTRLFPGDMALPLLGAQATVMLFVLVRLLLKWI